MLIKYRYYKGNLILNYGPDSNDTSFSNCQNGGVNVPLGFNLPYQNTTFSTVQIYVNGFVKLNSSVTVAAYTNNFCTNGSGGAVFYRKIDSPSNDLNIVTAAILTKYTNCSGFVASRAFVVTWFNVQSVSVPSQLNTFQMILATDGSNSFVIFEYVRLDSPSLMTCQAYFPANVLNTTSYLTSPDCLSIGSWVQIVNVGGTICAILYF
jgi:hypothetical protein